MKVAATVYTLASVAVLTLMIMRSPVEVTSPAVATTPTPTVEATQEATVAPTIEAAPEATVAPTVEAAPATTTAPTVEATPEATVAPTVEAAPATIVAPIVEAAPATTTAPTAEAAPATATSAFDTATPTAPNTAVNPEPASARSDTNNAAPVPATTTQEASPAATTTPEAATPEPMTAPTAAPANIVMPPSPTEPATPEPVNTPTPVTEPTSTSPSIPEEKKNDVVPTAANKPAPDANAIPDYALEQSITNEASATLTDGEVITLNDGKQNFMGILTPAEHPRGAVIILPGCGSSLNGTVAHPLRTGLSSKGWTTLSLQMPVLAKGATYYDYVPLFFNADKRIDAGIALLKQKSISPIVLAAHDCGSHMAMNWLSNKGDSEIAAYVGLGMGAIDAGQEMVQALPLDKLKVPVLDIYGEKDTAQVSSLIPARQTLIQKAGNTHSKQMVLPEADHDFTNKGDSLSAVIATWLNSLPL